MTEVFDVDAYIQATRKEPFRFRLGGQDFELPGSPQEIDWRVTEAADQGNVDALKTLFRHGLGAGQIERFNQLPQPSAAMSELFRRWQSHSGLKPGESPASPDSSASTAGPSTPPSTATTASGSPQPSTAA